MFWYVLGIQFFSDNGIFKLSQSTYIDGILKRFNIQSCFLTKTPAVKGDKFSKAQCPLDDVEKNKMKTVSYISIISNVMYA